MLCTVLSNGGTRTEAVITADIDYKTFLNWLGRVTDGDPFVQFFQAIKEAEEQGKQVRHEAAKRSIQEAIEGRFVRRVTKTVTKKGTPTEEDPNPGEVVTVEVTEEPIAPSWAAAFRLLESQLPDDYGRKQAIEHTGKDGGPIQQQTTLSLADMTEEELDLYERIQSRRHRDPKPGGDTGGEGTKEG